jgi:hypothetical protein
MGAPLGRSGSSHPGEAPSPRVGQDLFVTGRGTMSRAQLLLYVFGPDAEFEGQLVGALERLESGGALRILDVLFVGRDGESGEVVAVDLHGDRGGGVVAPLLGFRLDEAERRRATERVLHTSASADIVRELGAGLEPGAALAAVLVEHVWGRALDDAVARTGGTLLTNDFVDATALAELGAELVAAAGRGGG